MKKNEPVNQLQEKVLQDALELYSEDINTANKDIFARRIERIKTVSGLVRDIEIAKRISQGQMIRVFNIISTTPSEKKKYIRHSMPNLIPANI